MEPLETNKHTEYTNYRIQKSSELAFSISSYHRKSVIKRNTNPVFNAGQKYWDFVKVLKSQTMSRHWLFKIDSHYFVALAHQLHQGPDCVSIFLSNRKGQYDLMEPVAMYANFLDIEAGIDRFSQEWMALLIENKDPRVMKLF